MKTVMPTQNTADPYIGSLFDRRYLIDALIARGGMGNIYSSHDTKRGQRVALKLLRGEYSADRVVVQRFLREIQAMSQLKHPNSCQLLESGYTEEGVHYFAMELLQGQSLDSVINKRMTVSAETALDYIIQAASALCEAHSKGIVHRDLKPANIFIVQTSNAPDFIKVLDYGVAKIDQQDEIIFEPKLTNSGTTLGTPYYMSPEQIHGELVDGRADVYALAVILWESLFGSPPYLGKTIIDVFSAATRKRLPPLPKPYRKDPLYRAIYGVLKRALEKDAKKRYDSMQSFQRALEDLRYQYLGDNPNALTSSGKRRAAQVQTPKQLPSYSENFFQNLRQSLTTKTVLILALIAIAIVSLLAVGIYLTPANVRHEDTLYQTYKFFSDPSTEVYIDKRLVASTPSSVELSDSPPFDISFVSKEHGRYTFTIADLRDEVRGYAVGFAKGSEESSSIFIETVPPKATIYVNGTRYPLLSPCRIALDHQENVLISIELEGYRTEEILSSVRQGASLKIRSNLFRKTP